MAMHKGLIGKSEGGGSADLTLGDYINRVQRRDAFDQVAQEQKQKDVLWCKQMFDDAAHNAWPERLQVIIDKDGNGHIQGWGSALVLMKDGRWYMSDTSGA